MNTHIYLRMRRGGLRLWVAGALIALVGCYTEQRVVWSPDGQRAAVLSADGLRFCDLQGNLSGVLISNVTTVAWFNDSRQLAVGGVETCATWSQLAGLLRPEAREELRRQSDALLAQLLSAHPQNVLSDEKSKDENALKARLLLLRDRDAGAAATVAAAMQKAEMSTNLSVEVGTLAIASASGTGLEIGPRLAAEIGTVASIRLSPNNHLIAYTIDARQAQLWIASAGSEQPSRRISDRASLYPDWSPDGISLVYICTVNTNSDADDALALATVVRQRVVDDFGNIADRFARDELVGLLFSDQARVRCLRDGRILFASEEWRLPATTQDTPQRQQLFSLDPGRQSTVTKLVPRGVEEQLPASLSNFEVSPDEKQVAIGGDKSMVAVFTLATGSVNVLQSGVDVDLKSIPSWRSSNELCYVAFESVGTNKPTAEVVLWNTGKTNSISKSWPESARKGWLD